MIVGNGQEPNLITWVCIILLKNAKTNNKLNKSLKQFDGIV
jgi:hypothetical protein